jgi:hypothetical protein
MRWFEGSRLASLSLLAPSRSTFASSSKDDLPEVPREKLSRPVTQPPRTLLRFEKRTAWDHQYHINDVTRGKAAYTVKSSVDLRRRKEKSVEIWSSGPGQDRVHLLTITRQAFTWEWRIESPEKIHTENSPDFFTPQTSCRVKKQVGFGKTKFNISVERVLEGGEEEDAAWTLHGDKVSLLGAVCWRW